MRSCRLFVQPSEMYFYELLYCAFYLWRINLIWFDLKLRRYNRGSQMQNLTGRSNCFHWGISPENNRGDRLGCLKCSYGPVVPLIVSRWFVQIFFMWTECPSCWGEWTSWWGDWTYCRQTRSRKFNSQTSYAYNLLFNDTACLCNYIKYIFSDYCAVCICSVQKVSLKDDMQWFFGFQSKLLDVCV